VDALDAALPAAAGAGGEPCSVRQAQQLRTSGVMLRGRSGLPEAQGQPLDTVTNGDGDAAMHLADRAPPPRANTVGVKRWRPRRRMGRPRGGRRQRPTRRTPWAKAAPREADDDDGEELARALNRSLAALAAQARQPGCDSVDHDTSKRRSSWWRP